jgi:hypothetical protein
MSFAMPHVDQLLARRAGAGQAGRGHQKYNNEKVRTGDGLTFDSRAEYRHWLHLCWMLKTGQIRDLRRQVAFELAPGVRIAGRLRPPLRYIADFVYTNAKSGVQVVADVKGAATDVWRVKRHLMATVHGIEVREVRA